MIALLAWATLLLPPVSTIAAPPPMPPYQKWEKNIAAIEKRLAAAPPKPGAIFFAGSSSIVKWDLPKSFPDWNTVKVGFGGSQIHENTHFAGRILTPFQPSTIVFYAGDNDIHAGRKPETVAEDFKLFCATIHKAAPQCRIIYVAIKPSLSRRDEFAKQSRANALIRAYCATNKQLVFFDIVPLMLDAKGRPVPELFVKDGLHMSPAGYDRWNAALRKIIMK